MSSRSELVHHSESTGIPKELIVGNISLVPMPYEHDREVFNQNRQIIAKTMSELDVTIFEYFPWEIERENPWISGDSSQSSGYRRRAPSVAIASYYNSSIRPFFTEAAKIAKETKGHKVLVMDPAHDLPFLYIYGLFPFSQTAQAALVSYLFSMKKDTRREFLKFIWKSAGLLKITEIAQLNIEFLTGKTLKLNEASFRRAVVAAGIELISKDPNFNGARIGLLYPPTHIVGILEKLNNPLERESEILIHKADLLMLFPELRIPLFSIRQYEIGGREDSDKWVGGVIGHI